MPRTFTAQVVSLQELRKDAPLTTAIDSFFRSNYDLAPKTEEWYRGNLTAYLDWLRRVRPGEPKVSDVEKFLVDAFLKERISTPTSKYPKGSPFAARAAAVTLKRFANWLAQEGILQDRFGGSLLKNVRRTKVDEDVRRPLTDLELEAVLGAAGSPGSRDYAALVLMAGTGLRANEVREAVVGDVSLEDCTFTVRPETSKFGKSRVVHFHEAVGKELDRYLRQRINLDTSQPLFPSRSGQVFNDNGWDKVFQRIRKTSGVMRFTAHTLRHTWATNFMRQDGADLLQLKRQGGWSRWEMVERYSHSIPPKDRSALPNPVSTKVPLFRRPSSNRLRQSA